MESNVLTQAPTRPDTDPAVLDVGIVHDWFPTIGGGERVVMELVRAMPRSSVYGLFDFLSEAERHELVGERPIHTSRLNDMPFVARYYRALLLSCTRAIEEFDLSGHDVVVSSSAALAKGALTMPGQLHIAYVHTPARYAWDLSHEYIASLGGPLGKLKRMMAREMMHRFRLWDMRTPPSIDVMVANSHFIRARIAKVYGRAAEVIYPPVDTGAFVPGTGARDSFYLTASRLVPYKRIDLIVQAFALMPERRLVVIGEGPDMKKIRAIATRNVEILGYQPFEVLRDHMQRARAFVFAAREDFGIAPVEAQACGTPVIALGAGGTAETLLGLDHAEPTGVHFFEQSAKAIVAAVRAFEVASDRIDPAFCRRRAQSFGAERFRREISDLVRAHYRVGSDLGGYRR